MAVPEGFIDSKDYFTVAVEFLKKIEWIYKFPNTHLLAGGVLNQIPDNWKLYFDEISVDDLNGIALGNVNASTPETLKTFIEQCNNLKPSYNVENFTTFNEIKFKSLSLKKIHEIENFAPFIDKICGENGIKYIIDIGSGSGHLPLFLSKEFGYKILGIEANEQLVNLANKLKLNSKLVHYAKHFVTSDSSNEISDLFLNTFKEFKEGDKVCLIALHGCADLSINIFRLFPEIVFAETAIVMPCCYHRIKGDETNFENFPSCSALRDISNVSGVVLNRAFLRLACQQSNVVWRCMTEKAHDVHANNCLLRNILQEIVDEDKVLLKRKKRKSGVKNAESTIDRYVTTLEECYSFSHVSGQLLNEVEVGEIKTKLLERYAGVYKRAGRLIEALTALQVLLQGVCENLVLLDRCVYATDLGCSCTSRKVVDDHISPRCYALMVEKKLEN